MAIPRHLTITKTDSVCYHVFWEQNRWNPSRGVYVRLSLMDPQMGCSPCSIVKRIGCMPGERLVSDDGRYYCNDDFLGQAQMDATLPPFVYTGIIPPGQVFLIGDKETSYDSRYFGLKPLDDIETVLRPLF
jgi:type IV secretory pathway protease TraF